MTMEVVVRGPDGVGKTAVLKLIMGLLRSTRINWKLANPEEFEREAQRAAKLPDVATRGTKIILIRETTPSSKAVRFYKLKRDQRMIYHNTMGFLTAIDIVLRPRKMMSAAVFPVHGVEYLKIPQDKALAKELEADFETAGIAWEKVPCITIPSHLEH